MIRGTHPVTPAEPVEVIIFGEAVLIEVETLCGTK